MLDLNPETVEQIIDRAHQYQTGDEPAGSRDNLDEEVDLLSIDLAHAPINPVYDELKTAIDDLEPDQQVSLVALMWLGRGDYSVDEWKRALNRAGDSWNDRTADYLLRTPQLADYLSDGMELLRDEEG